MSSQIIKSTFFDNKVLSIELNNPLKRNALSLKMLDTLTMIVSQKNLENRYKILVLRGYQDGVFSAGADLEDIKILEKKNNLNIYHQKLDKLQKILEKINLLKVSILKSYCIGAGFILAMSTDIRIASQSCLFSIPASKLNIKLPNNQLNLLFSKFPKNQLLREAILSGRTFSSSEAYNFQIINKVFEDQSFNKNYIKYLEEVSKINSISIRYYHQKLF
ncbi:MAG: putative enoyl-CoA hydratase echA6 [Alphaproteobacteria bacterium MarineAlpha9_Bin4]|nr:MAG: putative enoyl-CoA hydratase echA6 [Alphaproteobacteria bacterium MarineAlpha9_Bin4]